ncbi:MAG: SpoIIE family protein phosphatase [Clostridia bacterium]|nr:SpoIIE family protein phosphatase [Clostridia bacterium]
MDRLMYFTENIRKKSLQFAKDRNIPLPTVSSAILFVVGILCGRATLLGLLRPFGGAFFAAVLSGRFSYLYMLAAVLGHVFSSAPLYEMGQYIFAMSFFALIAEKLPQKSKNSTVVRSSLFTFSLALSGLCFMFTSSGGFDFTTLYDLMLLFLECSVGFCAAALFHIAIPLVKSMKLSFSFSPTEEIALISLLGCALWGGKDISYIGFINVSNILCILIILLFSVRLGSGKGVIAGVTMGLVSALGSGRVDISCVSYSVSALAASLAGAFGAIPACSTFILANALVTALANGSTEVLINIYDIFIACILYSIIPEKTLLRLTNFGSRDEKNRLAADERCFGEYTVAAAANTVQSLDVRITRLWEKRKGKDETDSRFLERIAKKGCADCGMRRVCWSRDVQKTSLALTRTRSDLLETGKIKDSLLPANCLKREDLKVSLLSSAQIYKIEKMWQGKSEEMQLVFKKHAEAFAKILTATQNALSHPHTFDMALSDDISRKMGLEGIKCKDVVVMRDEDCDPTVMLRLDNCGGFSLCEKGVCEIVSSACGRKMVRAGKRDCRTCTVKYVPASASQPNFAVCGQSRDRKSLSGDSVRFRIISKNLYAFVLCDGMGFGERAAFEASGAADTLLDLIEAGVEGSAAMEIVNSLLIPFGEATFSAADLCLYDASDNTAQIIKCGSAASFTKSGDRVDALYSKNMPLGSVVKNSVESFTLSAKEGDIIVMISDGVLEGSKETALKDAWLIGELEDFNGDDPHLLADTIVKKALERCAENPRDDITVLAAFIG